MDPMNEKGSQLVPLKYSSKFQDCLIYAVKHNNEPEVIRIIEMKRRNPTYRINVNDGINNDNNTVLHLAAYQQHANIVKLLLDNGALVNAQDKEGVTPLGCALDQKNFQCTQILLEYGASQTIQDNQGDTPIFWLYKDYDDQLKLVSTPKEIKEFLKIHALLLCDRLKKLHYY